METNKQTTVFKVLDINTCIIETVVNTTSNSYEVTRTKLTDKGISCTNWFTEKEFKEKFSIVEQ